LVSCLLAALVGLVVAAPAQASGVSITITSPSVSEVVSGKFTVTFQVTATAPTHLSNYDAYVGRRLVQGSLLSCNSACTYPVSFTVDSSTSTWPVLRDPSSNGQIDDGPQQIQVRAYDATGTWVATGTSTVVVNNLRPTIALSAPALPPTVTDGRALADTSVRLEVLPGTTTPGAVVTAVDAVSGPYTLTTTAPLQPGDPWIVEADTSQWPEGPANLDVSVLDSTGKRSNPASHDLMVIHGFTLFGPALDTPVYDDAMPPVDLSYGYGQYVANTWPVLVETLVDGVSENRQTFTQADQATRSGVVTAVVPGVLPTGNHQMTFVVTDNRGMSEQLVRQVSVTTSASVGWLSGTDQVGVVGTPMTLTAQASTTYGSVLGWQLQNADTGEVLTAPSCSAQPCPTTQSQALTFTPRTAGVLHLRLQIMFGPVSRPVRVLTTSVTVLPAPTDFTGDRHPDVLARDGVGRLLLFRGNGKGGWAAPGAVIGTGWQGFTSVVSNGDLNGDLTPDIMARGYAGQMWVYGTNGRGGWSGIGEPSDLIIPGYTVVSGVGDFDGDGHTDVITRDAVGRLWLNSGSRSWRNPVQIGTGWQGFTSIFSTGDFDGDGHSDLLARTSDGRLMLYRGNGKGGWAASGRTIGTGWSIFTALTGIGDFDGDGHSDVLARTSDGRLFLYRGNGAGGWAGSGQAIGSGWQGFNAIIGVG
jgi:hypothetical protein